MRPIAMRASAFLARHAVPLAVACTFTMAVAPLEAQSLANRVSGVGDGTVQLRFASRPGVCGDGRGSIGTNGSTFMRRYSSDYGYDTNWCAPGPVRVVLDVRGGDVNRARVYVGGNDSSAAVQDLGMVGAREAADYFLSLARDARRSVGDDAILAAVLADSVTPWRDLFGIARDESVHKGTRSSALFWLSRAAAASVNHRELFAERDGEESDRDEVRNAAIFALSQQPHDEGVPALIRVARSNGSPAARDRALFWLGQSGDPRALDLFAEILELH